ncbi:MAG: hypothetical protein Q9166_007576 [cf. Caloplaca sp. 2 TL-2023]
MSSYTYTDLSVDFFNEASGLFRAYSNKMTFKVLDVEKAPATQGFEPHSYDVVIASNVLHATASLQRTLEHVRQLLKPGGLPITALFGSATLWVALPGCWAGVEDGRKYAPTITPGEWHTALRKAGFSGVETTTPEIGGLPWALSVMAAQTVDDRVHFLKRLLSHSSSPTSIYLESVVILGTGSLENSRIAEEVEDYLGRFCGQITILNDLPTEAEALTSDPTSTFINLVDIDSPIFKGMTAERMDGLKRLFELAKHILWITQGAQADEPYHQASIAFSRAMSHEAGHINLNHLDVSDLEHNISKVITEYLLQQCALDEWEAPRNRQQHQQLLWSKEPEAFLDLGQLMIRRLVDSVGQNAGLNSSRRVITKKVPLSSSNVSISLSADSSLVEQILPIAIKVDQSLVKVESSILTALHVAADTFLFFGIGRVGATNDTVVVLSTTNSCQTTPIASVTVDASNITQSADRLLIAIASELLAASLIETVSSGSSILVHCSRKDRFLAAALSRFDNVKDPTWIKLNVRAPRHVLRRMLLPAKPTHFLDLTVHPRIHPSDLSLSIAQILPSGYKRIDPSSLSQHQSLLPLSCGQDLLIARLEDAVSSASTVATSTAQEKLQDLVVPLDQVKDPSVPNHTTSVVRWPLRGDVTIEGTNPTVKIFAMDITDKHSLEKVVKEINASHPLVAGVISGAMVLHDTLFARMSLETMQEVFGPKIDGTNNLDQLFHDDELDYLVMLSSSACVIGNSGQANYAAANGYLNSLPRQRRKRGLAASTVDIGRVAGIGYVETAGQAVVNQLTRFGLMVISETEFHQMLAEPIRAGYPDTKDKDAIPDAVVTTGIRTIRDDEDIQGPWFDNPLLLALAEVDAGQQNKKTMLPVSEQLSRAATMEQALEILQECFSAKLRLILQISEPTIDHDVPLIELGVDSLVAVEVRSWVLKELKVDIPVLKMVGGASPAEICQQVLKRLPEELLASIGEQEPHKPVLTHSIMTQSQPEPPVTDSSSTSETDSTPASLLTPNDGSISWSSTQLSSKSTSSETLADLAKLGTRSPPPAVAAAVTVAERPLRKFLKSEQISFEQSRFWFLLFLLEDQTISNVAFYYQVTGNLHIADVERAIRIITTRHEALRTCFVGDRTEADQA